MSPRSRESITGGPPVTGTVDTAVPPSLTFVQHWFEELRRLVPTE